MYNIQISKYPNISKKFLSFALIGIFFSNVVHAAGIGPGWCWCRDWEIGHPNDPSYYQNGDPDGWAGNCDICRAHCMTKLITGFAYNTQNNNPQVGVCFGGTASSNCEGCDRSPDPDNPGVNPFQVPMDASRKNQSSNNADQGKQLKFQSPQMPVKR